MNNYNFFNSLSAEQKDKLREMLKDDYRIDVEFYDKENTRIARIREYYADKLHGLSMGWYYGGEKHWETNYLEGKVDGKDIEWLWDGSMRQITRRRGPYTIISSALGSMRVSVRRTQ